MKKILPLALALISINGYSKNAEKRPNVLMIAVDDLRPEMGCYGVKQMKTPNLDKLAGKGVVFNNSFCSVPVCGASRASLLTGVRATPTRFIVAKTSIEKDLPGHLSLPRYLKQNGYTTISLGKVYHVASDDATGWSVKPQSVQTKGWLSDYLNEESVRGIINSDKKANTVADEDEQGGKRGPAFEIGNVKDDYQYRDGQLALKAIETLDTLKKSDKPFFLAVGFLKPHLPFNAPKKYYDMYTDDEIKLATNSLLPKNAPDQAFMNMGELRQYAGVPKDRIIPDEYGLKLKHSYYACVSYVDAMIGEVINKLEKDGMLDNTIIILWGDHGWNLGEHKIWGKHNLFETALRAPLIISAPGLSKNQHSNSLAEFIDIYPTLADLCGLGIPKHCQGKSLVPILKDVNKEVKDEVFCRWKSGEGIHTHKYAYSEWSDKNNKIEARMLYDLTKDPNETVNISESPEYSKIADMLSAKIKENIATR